MQNSFNIARLWLLIKKQWFDNAKLYTLAALALIGVLVISFTIWWIANKDGRRFTEEGTYAIEFLVLFSTGLIFASITFGMLGDKAKGIYWLSVPATPLEKLFCGFFYTFLVFPLIFFTSFWLVKHLTFFFIELDPANELRRIDPNNIFIKVVTPNILYAFFSLQALFLLGSVFFEKFAFLKTVLVVILIAFLFIIFVQLLTQSLLPLNFGIRGFTEYRIYNDSGSPNIIQLPAWIGNILEVTAKFIWVPVLLTATYFRLKEKEI